MTPPPASTSWARRSGRPTSRRCARFIEELGLSARGQPRRLGERRGARGLLPGGRRVRHGVGPRGILRPAGRGHGSRRPHRRLRVTAVPETVGGAGLVLDDKSPVPFAAAVGRVLRDETLRGVLAAAGRHRAAGFDLAASTQRFVSLVQEAVASCRGPRPGCTDADVADASAAERQDQVGGAVAGRGQVERLEPLPAGLGQRVAQVLVARRPGRRRRRARMDRWRRPAGRRRRRPRAAHRPDSPRRAGPCSSPRARARRSPRAARSTRARRTRRMAATRSASLRAPVKVTASWRPISSTKRRSASV